MYEANVKHNHRTVVKHDVPNVCDGGLDLSCKEPQKPSDVASFPDSTPQLFIALCDKKLGSDSAIKSWGVESGNEAN